VQKFKPFVHVCLCWVTLKNQNLQKIDCRRTSGVQRLQDAPLGVKKNQSARVSTYRIRGFAAIAAGVTWM
jgi:hypothetical protein